MILAEDSLVALNKEFHLPMEMERFRPNIVVTGLRAFEEVSSLSTNVFLTLFLGGCFFVKDGLNFMQGKKYYFKPVICNGKCGVLCSS